jgi:hypothetical protein
MSTLTFLVVVVAVLCVIYQPAKVLAIITLLLLATSNPVAAVFTVLLIAAFYHINKTKRK